MFGLYYQLFYLSHSINQKVLLVRSQSAIPWSFSLDTPTYFEAEISFYGFQCNKLQFYLCAVGKQNALTMLTKRKKQSEIIL